VLGVLKDTGLRRSLETKIAGESLFNDGVAYVVFLILVGLAFPGGDARGGGHGGGAGALEAAAILFVQEAMGGAVLGLALGFATYRLMRRIDDHSLEVLLTLALAFGGYQLAVLLNVSAPIMAVCAGLLIGDATQRRSRAPENAGGYLDAFWKLVNEVLNAVLFLMIGVEVFAVALEFDFVVAGILSIGLALLGRLAAVTIPVLILGPFRGFSRGVIPIMTWGGIKGGISIALALSLPPGEWQPLILTATYAVVIFSILVQGLTVARVATRFGAEPDPL
jgi:CPA1 family monovalent cation:H+ antiporter